MHTLIIKAATACTCALLVSLCVQVFDYVVDNETHNFCKWSDLVPSYTGTPHQGIPHDAFVHTVHTEVRRPPPLLGFHSNCCTWWGAVFN